MKIYLVVVALLAYSVNISADWRKTGSQNQQVKQLVSSLPGAAHVMFELGERYKNIFYAARQGKWKFAEYQAEEIESLVRRLQITRPKRAKTAAVFLTQVFPELNKAIAKRDWKHFSSAFDGMKQQCEACHVSNDHAFILLSVPRSASSPVLQSE